MHLQTLFEYRQARLGITVVVVMDLICVGGIKYAFSRICTLAVILL